MTTSYWCHICERMGNPIMELDIKCPFCRSGFIEELESLNSYYNAKFRGTYLDGQLVFFRCQNLRCFTKDDDEDNNNDNGVSHHRSEIEGHQLFIVDQGIFFHDHKKCIESQQRSRINSFDLDLVLPGHEHGHGPDSVCTAEHQESKQAEADLYSPRCYPEQVELPVADLLISSTDQTSPPRSPSNSDFTPCTPSAWEFGEVEFELKEEEEEEEEDI